MQVRACGRAGVPLCVGAWVVRLVWACRCACVGVRVGTNTHEIVQGWGRCGRCDGAWGGVARGVRLVCDMTTCGTCAYACVCACAGVGVLLCIRATAAVYKDTDLAAQAQELSATLTLGIESFTVAMPVDTSGGGQAEVRRVVAPGRR